MKRVHFIGIGGIGMSGIAEILVRSGYQVSGSDLRQNTETAKLKGLGARIYKGHQSSQVGDAEMVVFSSAVSSDNPEMMEAKRLGLPVLARSEMLAELMRKKRSIVVAGAHGKTTTSAMITTLLLEAGFDPTAVIGGRLRRIAGNAKMGTDEWFVAESDESDGSFLHLLPMVAVITNVDREHLDHYGSFENLEQAFVDFGNRVPFDGVVILCRDDAPLAKAIPKIDRPVVTYGMESEADVTAKNVRCSAGRSNFTVVWKGETVCDLLIPVTGKHNVLNALAAAAVGHHLGLSWGDVSKGLAAFTGIDRRLETKGECGGIRVIDDYAHHPTEIRASLEALRLMAAGGAVRVLFQPHRYTRVRDLWKEFVAVFDLADEVVVAPIYAASERPISGVESERLVKEIVQRRKTSVRYARSLEEGSDYLSENVKKGDLLVTMGAGDVTKMAGALLEKLQRATPKGTGR
ncbi:MAG TPA: UDP-N-acetylmuramate--L-alanine ligase [Bdellovibrionota bacterium]|nr:UDP-N-acetylmuramate--L-alanine ligase [Bdellovibrionota bacterium]